MPGFREVSLLPCNLRQCGRLRPVYQVCAARKYAYSQAAVAAEAAAQNLQELENNSGVYAPPVEGEDKATFRPWQRAKLRKFQLPRSKYQFHPPKYERGPLHPIQSPPSWDPRARDFVPDPFHFPRLKQTYQTTIAPDLMTLAYLHVPPGTPEEERPDRLRKWDDSSPYHENRPKRGPRGYPELPILERDITFRNIPRIEQVTLSSYEPDSITNPDKLLVARTVLLAITGALPEITKTKSDVAQWGIRKGQRAGVKVTVSGNQAYEFLDRVIHHVFPKIKDWKGVRGTTGDGSGNLAWGFSPENLALFPEIVVNYDMYPPKMIPGCHVFVKTSATADRQARLLLKAMGVPLHGEIVD